MIHKPDILVVSACLMVATVISAPLAPKALADDTSPSRTLPSVSVPGSVSPLLSRAQRLARVAGRSSIGLAIALRVRHTGALNQYLIDLYNPASPSYHHFLTSQQFAASFAPDASARASVVRWLHTKGLDVTGTSNNGLLISARASAARLESVFNSPLYTFRLGSRNFYANTHALQLPGAIAQDVVAVSGLSTAAEQQTSMRPLASGLQGYTPSDLTQLYNVGSLRGNGIDGTGQTVGIVSFADYSDQNVGTFDSEFGLSVGTLSRVSVSDGRTTGAGLGSRNGQDEAEADIEVIQGIAPRANIVVYEAPNSSAGTIAVYNRIVSDNRAQVVTSSWGVAESQSPSSEINALHQLFQEAAAQGQAVFAASGDNGAFDAAANSARYNTTLAVDYPSSDPWVTGVGGTTLDSNGSQYAGETAWSMASLRTPTGTGGGLSELFARPSYQTGPGVTNQYSNGMRQVPDVAADADSDTGYALYTVNSRGTPTWGESGGTSMASPLWAGFAALVNQALGRQVGFLNPALYALGQQSAGGVNQPFHDITQGTNLYYPATPGWDFATGWGSFDAVAFVAAIRTVNITTPPTPSRTAVPTPTPRPTAAPASPTISVQKVLLLHSVNGSVQQTNVLKVGEKGTMMVVWQGFNAGSMPATGSVTIMQSGQVVQTISLTATLYGGKPALTASLRFTSAKRVGTLTALTTVKLGTASTVARHDFKLVKGS